MCVFKSKYGHMDCVWVVDEHADAIYSGSVINITFCRDGVIEYEVYLDQVDNGDLGVYQDDLVFASLAEAEKKLAGLRSVKRERDIFRQKLHIANLETQLREAQEDLKKMEEEK